MNYWTNFLEKLKTLGTMLDDREKRRLRPFFSHETILVMFRVIFYLEQGGDPRRELRYFADTLDGDVPRRTHGEQADSEESIQELLVAVHQLREATEHLKDNKLPLANYGGELDRIRSCFRGKLLGVSDYCEQVVKTTPRSRLELVASASTSV